MAKRYIGIDLDGTRLSYAALTLDQGQLRLSATAQQELTSSEQLGPALRELIGDEPTYNDRLATSLSASQALTRTLTFPFADTKKIAAALPYELGTQLPVELDEHEIAGLSPLKTDEGHLVTAAAIDHEVITTALTPFDEAGLPLHILDLAPFAYAAGLPLAEDGMLVILRQTEFTIATIHDGRISAQRTRHVSKDAAPEQLTQHIFRECRLLNSDEEVPLLLLGPKSDALVEPLSTNWPEVRLADPLPGTMIEPELRSAVTMALRAYHDKTGNGFNFRRGRFSLRGEWQNLRRRLIGIGTLTLLTILCVSITAWISHRHRTIQADQLRQDMVAQYRTLFPSAQAIVDVPLQLTAKIDELRGNPLLAIDQNAASPLYTIREISARTPDEISITLRSLEFEPGTTRLEGRTSSFDAINRFAAALGQSPLFTEVQIDEAKMSADGKQVDFRLSVISGKGEES